MPSKQQKERMAEYLANSLTAAGHSLIDYEVGLNHGNTTAHYFKLDDSKEKGVMLINDSTKYNEKNTNELIQFTKNMGMINPAFVVYKDGKHFFRCPESNENKLKSLTGKLHPNRSLKNYIDRLPSEFIEPTKAERRIRTSGFLQYYQPKSERLDEMLVTFGFEIPILDYSHISSEERYGPVRKPSERYFLTENRFNMPGALELDIERDSFLRNPKN